MISQVPTHEEQLAALVLASPAAAAVYERLGTFYSSFVPRPDDVANFDQQTSFINNQDKGVAWHIGGNACLAPEQELYDPVADCHRKIGEIDGPTHLWSRNPRSGNREIGRACTPFLKGQADLYRVELSNGQHFVCTLGHKILCQAGGWRGVRELAIGDRLLSSPFEAGIRPDRPSACVPPLDQIQSATGPRLLPHLTHLQSTVAQLPTETGCTGIPDESPPPLSSADYKQTAMWDGIRSLFSQPSTPANRLALRHVQCFARTSRQDTTLSRGRLATDNRLLPDIPLSNLPSLTKPLNSDHLAYVTQITVVRQDADFYDLNVYPHHNYELGGVYHHNSGTTEAAMCKLARFVLNKQPPPRKDTPFWIIGPSYEQTIESCWCEKLEGHGHIPKSEIVHEKMTWYDSRKNQPFTVPLKPWPGHNPEHNWRLEFKSYEQGRDQMQARSLGGYCFVEQFPHELLIEVHRGTRETDYPGSRFCEFTPVDPAKNIEIQEMIENDSLPDGWAVYRSNTRKNMADPNSIVSEEWGEGFFSMVSDEMQETRATGAFASFEGAIYKSFNRQIHLTDGFDFPPAVYHRRSIDWGASVEHPFVCLWGYRDALGCWYIYDEYHSASEVLTSLDHIQEINDRHWWNPNSPYHGQTYADPSRPGEIRLFQVGGLSGITGAKNDVDDGIETVRRHLKITPSTGEPLLFIDKINCPVLARQMSTYRWKRSSGSGLNPQTAQRVPLKRDDDCVDALRYLIHSEYTEGGVGLQSRSFNAPMRLKGQFKRKVRR